MFSASDMPNRNATLYIEDYMLLRGQQSLGVIKLANHSFVTFRINSLTSNTYFHRRNLTNFRAYYFDQVNNFFYWGNGTAIMNTSLVVAQSSGVVTNVSMVDTVLYRNLPHTSFQFVGSYLMVGCTTCDSNQGRIQIYNYTQPQDSSARNTTTTSTLNNITLILELNRSSNAAIFGYGEKFFY